MGGARLVCMFHLNLAFSSLPSERRGEIVERCYWPMLGLADAFPIAFEATGWTLERIAEHDPAWIAKARELVAAGRAELVGSAYAQCAAPLLPADVNRWNLRLGLDVYERLLGLRPRVALLSEQAYSPGLVPLYAKAGYDAIVADWDNAYRSHPEWEPDAAPRPAARGRRRRHEPPGRLERVDRVPEVPALRARRARARALRRLRARRRPR